MMAAAVALLGRPVAEPILAEVAAQATALGGRGRRPALALVVATDDEGTAWYVRSLEGAAAKVGIETQVVNLGPEATRSDIETSLRELDGEWSVDGVLLQTPLPPGLRLQELAGAISPAKDVDGANPLSAGRLTTGLDAFPPATAEAVVTLLDHYDVELSGQRVAVVGRSNVVGKPLTQLLLARDATVTVCHSRTVDLAGVTAAADIVVAAAGRIGLLTPAHVRPGAVVVDVGTNPTAGGGLAGDVDPAVRDIAGALTPVPGGVGPVTTALLLRHVVQAAASARRA